MNENNSAINKLPRFLTIRETAKLGVVSELYLRRGVKQGSIPGFKSGTRFYVNLPKLMKQLDADED